MQTSSKKIQASRYSNERNPRCHNTVEGLLPGPDGSGDELPLRKRAIMRPGRLFMQYNNIRDG